MNLFTEITRRMAIANGTCVSFFNQPKTHFGLPWVCPWDNRGKCYMDGKMIQCWSNTMESFVFKFCCGYYCEKCTY